MRVTNCMLSCDTVRVLRDEGSTIERRERIGSSVTKLSVFKEICDARRFSRITSPQQNVPKGTDKGSFKERTARQDGPISPPLRHEMSARLNDQARRRRIPRLALNILEENPCVSYFWRL